MINKGLVNKVCLVLGELIFLTDNLKGKEKEWKRKERKGKEKKRKGNEKEKKGKEKKRKGKEGKNGKESKANLPNTKPNTKQMFGPMNFIYVLNLFDGGGY